MKKLALIAVLVSTAAIAQADDQWNHYDRHGDYDRHVDEGRRDARFRNAVPLAAMDISRKETVDFNPHRDQFRALRVRALRGAAYVDFITIRFGNSEQQHIDVRRRIGAGETFDIDLNGVRGLAAITVHGRPDRWSRIQVIGLR
jgi:hypothetical protein